MFVDTNVIVRARMPGAPRHVEARALLETYAGLGEPLKISRQVIREFLAVATRGQEWSPPMTGAEAVWHVREIMEFFKVLDENSHTTERLLPLCQNYPVGGRQIHDANIVATMLAYGERRLPTFNAADFRRYGDLIELAEV